MRAAADFLDRVVNAEAEHHFSSVNLFYIYLYCDLQPERGRRKVIDRDMRADRILASVEMLEEEVAAGVLDIAHHAARGVHHAFPAHEADAASLVDGERAVRRKILLQRRLHARRSYTTALTVISPAAPE